MMGREIALEFVRRFCKGDVAGLEPLIASDLRLMGPLFRFSSRAEYLQSLKQDPPPACSCRILSVIENGDAVSVFYDYEKADRTLTIAQLFKIREQKIAEIFLVFDARGFG